MSKINPAPHKFEPLDSTLGGVLFFSAFLAILYWIASHPKKNIQPVEHRQQEYSSMEIAPITKPRKGSYLRLWLLLLSLLTISGGLYLNFLIQSPTYPSIDSQTPFELRLFADYNTKISAPLIPLKDYQILIFLTPSQNSNNVEVFVTAKDTIRRPLGSSWNIPKFFIEFPGKVTLADEIDKNYYDIRTFDNRTLINTKYFETPNVRLKWFNGVQRISIFQRRISIKLGERIDSNIDWKQSDILYSVAIVPMLPPESRITFQRPTTVDDVIKDNQQSQYTIGVTSEYASSAPGDDRIINVADSNFEIIYENAGAEQQRNLIFIIIGLLFGLGGNVLSSLLVEWASSGISSE